jgi:hypothetical protein
MQISVFLRLLLHSSSLLRRDASDGSCGDGDGGDGG